MNNYWVNFWNKIIWRIEADHFSVPFWNRQISIKLLEEYSKKIATALIAIDWTNFSSNVISIDTSTYDIWNVDFLEPWIDWVIMTWLKDIDKTRFNWKVAVWSILWVWDCSPIIGSNTDWSIIFNIHWWYKWILWNWEENNSWIIFSFIDSLEKQWIYPSKIWKVHLWPMAWKDFELPLDYYKKLIKYISKDYKLIDFMEYFKINGKTNEKWQKLGYLDLRWIVYILLRYHWISMYNIDDSGIDTTNRSNNWPSYRLYSNWLQEKNSRLSSTIAKLLV